MSDKVRHDEKAISEINRNEDQCEEKEWEIERNSQRMKWVKDEKWKNEVHEFKEKHRNWVSHTISKSDFMMFIKKTEWE